MQKGNYTAELPIIYKITSPSGSVYIGQSRKPKGRISAYKNISCKGQRLLYNSFKKYGWIKHTFKIICELPIDISQVDLDSYENLYWELYLSVGAKMLNLRCPGSRGLMTEEIKRKISNTHFINSHLKNKSKIGTTKFRKGSGGYNYDGIPF